MQPHNGVFHADTVFPVPALTGADLAAAFPDMLPHLQQLLPGNTLAVVLDGHVPPVLPDGACNADMNSPVLRSVGMGEHVFHKGLHHQPGHTERIQTGIVLYLILKLMLIVVIGEMFFRAETLSQGFAMFKLILTDLRFDMVIDHIQDIGIDRYGYIVIIAGIMVVSLVEMLTVSGTGPIGLIMNVLSTSAFALPAALMYRNQRSLKRAALGLGLGVLCMTVVMLAWNYIITPLYMAVPRAVVAGMLLPTFLPFNLVKGGLNAGITMLVYKPVSGALHRAGLLGDSKSASPKRRFNLPATIISAFVVVTSIIVLIIMSR